MKHHPEMYEPDIEALAMNKTFGDLTEQERAFVVAHLGGAKAYEEMRALLMTTRRTLMAEGEMLEPRETIRAAAHAAMRARSGRRPAHAIWGALARAARYRVPVYQPVTGALAAFAVLLLLHGATLEPQPRERIVYREIAAPAAAVDTDEIVRRVVDSLKEELERPAQVEVRTVVVRSDRPATAPGSPEESTADTAERRARRPSAAATENRFVGLANLPQLDAQRRGKNLAEDSAGSKFMVSTVQDRF